MYKEEVSFYFIFINALDVILTVDLKSMEAHKWVRFR